MRIPALALFRSVHAGSVLPLLSWHIEPVRSSTSMMSTGFDPHGEHAAAWTCTWNEFTPTIFEKNVGTTAVSSTDTMLTGLQPGMVLLQAVLTCSATDRPASLFFPVEPEPYCLAVAAAADASGSCCAPASAAASAVP